MLEETLEPDPRLGEEVIVEEDPVEELSPTEMEDLDTVSFPDPSGRFVVVDVVLGSAHLALLLPAAIERGAVEQGVVFDRPSLERGGLLRPQRGVLSSCCS